MRWTEIFEAREIPSTDYGYWIRPDGSYVVVPPYRHEAVLYGASDKTLSSYEEAAQAGWLRVVFKPYRMRDAYSLSVQADHGIMSARAFASLAALANNDKIDNFYADMGQGPGDAKSFGTREPFMAFVRQRRR